VTSIGAIYAIIILFNMAKPQTKRKNVIADLTTQAKGTVLICFVKLFFWILAYFTYIRNPDSDTPGDNFMNLYFGRKFCEQIFFGNYG
jgi:hypothetical protein